MDQLILELHGWMPLQPTDDHDTIAMFNFSLMPDELRKSGKRPEHTDCFWTEVKLDRFLAEQPGWKKLSQGDKVKAMFRYAQEQIQATGRKVRHLEIFWTPQSPRRDGPAYDLASIRFPKAPPVLVERETADAPRFLARKGAGHLA